MAVLGLRRGGPLYRYVHSVLYTVNSYQERAVFVTTPQVETPRHLAIELVLNNELPLDVNRTFEYRSNPVFADIRPRNHLVV